MDDAGGVAHRPGRASSSASGTTRASALTPTAVRRPITTHTTSSSARSGASTASSSSSSSASRCSRTAACPLAAQWEFDGDGYCSAVGSAPDSDLTLRLRTDLRLGVEGSRARARTTLREGDEVFAALALSDHPPPETFREAFDRIAQTSEFWREWLGGGRFPDHPWREHLQRSALTLKGLIFAPTGAMLAASTTSLPETPHGERNWDYRYAWIRDSTFGLWGLYTLGFDSEANDFFHFVADAAEGAEDLQVMYTVKAAASCPSRSSTTSAATMVRGRCVSGTASEKHTCPTVAAC